MNITDILFNISTTPQAMQRFFNSSFKCAEIGMLMAARNDWTALPLVRAAFTMFYSILFALGLLGNVAMVFTITRLRRYISVANIFLLNLGVCDVILCFTAVPITPVHYLLYTWHLGIVLCKVVPFCQAVSVIVSNLSLCAIAADRYNNIVHPTRHTQFTRRHAIILTTSNWAFAIFLSLPILANNKLVTHRHICGTFCKEAWDTDLVNAAFAHHVVSLLLVGVTYCGPLLLQTFCSIRILLTVKRDMVIDALETRNTKSAQIVVATRRKRRVMYTLIAMMATFGVSWLPLTLLNVSKDFAFLHYLHPILQKQTLSVQFAAHAVAMTCVVWNPVLYFWMSQSHRDELRREVLSAAVMVGVDRWFGKQFYITPPSTRPLSSTHSRRNNRGLRESRLNSQNSQQARNRLAS